MVMRGLKSRLLVACAVIMCPLSVAFAEVTTSDIACGVGSLYAVSRLCNQSATLSDIEERMGPSGANGLHDFNQIIKASRDLGLKPIAAKLDMELFRELPAAPVIVQLRPVGASSGHFTVMFAKDDKGLWILDLPREPVRVTWQQFQARWSGNAIFFARSDEQLGNIEALLMQNEGSLVTKWILFLCEYLRRRDPQLIGGTSRGVPFSPDPFDFSAATQHRILELTQLADTLYSVLTHCCHC